MPATPCDNEHENLQCTPYDLEKPTQGWTRLGEMFNSDEPLWRNTWFLEGYNFSSNIYVIEDDGLTVIDPGNDYTAYLQFFDLGFDPAQVRRVMITHGHFDHAMGVLELCNYRGIREKGSMEIIIHEAGPEELKKNLEPLSFPLRLVQGGETVHTGRFSFQVVHTPGHTFDGISLYHKETRSLFSGDAVLPYGLSAPDKHGGGRLDHMLQTFRNLLGMNIDHVMPGHGWPVFGLGRKVLEASYEEVIKHLLGVNRELSCEEAANRLIGKGLFEEALYCAEKSLQCGPSDATAMLRLKIVCLNDMGRFQEALESLAVLKSILPEADEEQEPFQSIATGYALMGLERYEEAVAVFDDVLTRHGRIKEALVYKGMALHLAGRHDEAMDIGEFRDEFVGRFKEELMQKVTAKG
ncbi:MBL fold metallo-hydrolase [Desulfosoma caldarium]|uniref:Glyoxylase-like metal-dependent hydrolase (Beta-lactamase superfamily II) n=1 Tax=Desulfosoma caldarium TaxID=610254 RepID=A0A3N1UVH5_9BACT|nr:MBL fold metallo-hydrolase [Desulfosoma caldarium]ROQ93419.1 glyoxylase-like metal-dependent hydrolase (beta-lactamase superfamily II) [Desulfosoma caldarium]